MTIRMIFFDMGGTIETLHESMQIRLNVIPQIRQVLTNAGINPHLENKELYRLLQEGLDRYRSWSDGALSQPSPEAICCDYILSDLRVPEEKIAEVAEDVVFLIETRFYKRQMRSEVPSVLMEMREMGLRLGIISNVMSRGQVPYCLNRYRIAEYFDPVILSSEYGRRKPDPQIFLHAADMAGDSPCSCVHVGDKVNRDILGAKKAGFRLSIKIIHQSIDGQTGDMPGMEPGAVVETLTEIPEIVRSYM